MGWVFVMFQYDPRLTRRLLKVLAACSTLSEYDDVAGCTPILEDYLMEARRYSQYPPRP